MKFQVRAWFLDNLGLKLFSLGLAFLLWLMVINEQKAEEVMNYPLKLRNVPAGMVIVNDVTGALSVKLRGPKSLLAGLTPDEIALDLGSRRLNEGENYLSVRPVDIKVPRGIEVLGVTPARLRVVLEGAIEKGVKVVPRVKGVVAKGYSLRGMRVEPPEVKVVGARSLVATLNRVHTLPIDVEGKTRGFQEEARVDLPSPRLALKENRPVLVRIEIREAVKRP